MAPIALSIPEPPRLSIEPKSLKSIKHDSISVSEQPASIDDFLPLKGKTGITAGVPEILCTAFGLALRCYSTESVNFEYHDEAATESRSTSEYSMPSSESTRD